MIPPKIAAEIGISHNPLRSLVPACRVTCETSDDARWTVYVPRHLLWDAGGMAELFRICQRWLADPTMFDDEPNQQQRDRCQELWDFFHVVAIEECDGFVMNLEPEPEGAMFEDEAGQKAARDAE